MPIGLSAGAVAAIGAGVSAAGSVAGSLISSSAASSAADKQSAASYDALVANQQQVVDQAQFWNQLIGPGLAASQQSLGMLNQNRDALTPFQNALAPGGITQQTLQNTPGYQFDLAQGLQATQSAAAARGLGVSGAALKGAASYATGLADNTYQNQYSDALGAYQAVGNQNNQLFNQNQQIANLGLAAQTNQSNQIEGYQAQQANLATNAANAQGASAIAGANAVSGGFNGVSNALNNYGTSNLLNTNNQLLQNYLANSGSMYGVVGNTSGGVGTGVLGGVY